MPFAAQTIHATALVAGDTGVLIRGRSGAGKSTLARQMLTYTQRNGQFSRLVSDDRVHLISANGRLLANSIPTIEGMLEVRGIGLVSVPFLASAVIDLVVDLDALPQRLPDDCDKTTTLLSISLPGLALGGISDALERVIWFIAQRARSKV